MIGFPDTTALPCPFASDGDKGPDFKEQAGIEEISYRYGIPVGYSVPNANGGSKLTRQQMNRLGYISTIGSYLMQCGIPVSFSRGVSDAIGGYPMGAILKYIDEENGIVNDVISLVDDNTNDFRDTPYHYEPNVAYDDGDVVRVYDQSVGSKINFYKCNEPVSANDNTSWSDVVGSFSLIDEDDAGITHVGPTSTNKWKFVNEVNKNFWPDLSIDYEHPSFTQSVKQSAEFNSIEVGNTGWLYVRLSRPQADFSKLSFEQMKNAILTCAEIKVSSEYSATSSDSGSFPGHFSSAINLMALQSNSVLIPVIRGSLYTISVSNPGLEQLEISAWEIGTVNA